VVKKRFLQQYRSIKLFETYLMEYQPMTAAEEDDFCARLERLLPEHDVVIVADYGHGLMTSRAVELVCEKSKFLALNVQTNAGNKGFNFVTRYPRANLVSIDENEARLEARDNVHPLEDVIETIAEKIACQRLIVTSGSKGATLRVSPHKYVQVPALALKTVDRIGAGDALLSLVSPLLATGTPDRLALFLGNVAAAEKCATIGNKRAIDKESYLRHVCSLLG
jgi:bifunctional ADP-heptose synthase (sugar kinase/adenylyltransferase)